VVVVVLEVVLVTEVDKEGVLVLETVQMVQLVLEELLQLMPQLQIVEVEEEDHIMEVNTEDQVVLVL